jgi:hypothetical protein
MCLSLPCPFKEGKILKLNINTFGRETVGNERYAINLSDRYRTIQRPGDPTTSNATSQQQLQQQPPSNPPAPRKNTRVEELDDDDSEEKNAANAPAVEKPIGPKLPKRVASAAINKSALYHFQR